MADVFLTELESSSATFPVTLDGGSTAVKTLTLASQAAAFLVRAYAGDVRLEVLTSTSQAFPTVAFHGSGSGLPVAVDRVPFSPSTVYPPLVLLDVNATTSLITSTSATYDFSVGMGIDVPVIPYSGSVFDISASASVQFSVSEIQSTAQTFNITVDYYNGVRPPLIPSTSYVYPVAATTQKVLPLLMRLATPLGGLTTMDISPYQQYYTVVDPSMARVAKSSAVLSRYIPSQEVLSSTAYYDAFYIVNATDMPTLLRKDIYFSLTGGVGYRVVGSSATIYEADSLLGGVSSELSNEAKLLGATRTSTFGQLELSYLVSPAPDGSLVEFSSDGKSKYLDLTRQLFVPGTQRTRLPDLLPGRAVGIYLKVEPKFSEKPLISKDYSFVNLSYINHVIGSSTDNDTRESYPGLARTLDGGVIPSKSLPSVYFEFYSGYGKIVEEIAVQTERLFNRYPPYMLTYEDIAR